jgi:hypothetical protein
MNPRQFGFPLNTCNLGISDGQHVFSKPLFPSTSIVAVSIRSFTEKSVCFPSSFSKVALLKASFFFVFVFVKGSLMIDDVLTKTVITVRERRQEENESKPWRAKKEKKKEKSRKKTGAQKTSSFSRFETTNFDTKQHTLVRVLLSLSRRRRGRSKRRAFLLVPLLKSDRLRRRRRKKTKDDGVDFLRVVVVQFRRHPKKGATT